MVYMEKLKCLDKSLWIMHPQTIISNAIFHTQSATENLLSSFDLKWSYYAFSIACFTTVCNIHTRIHTISLQQHWELTFLDIFTQCRWIEFPIQAFAIFFLILFSIKPQYAFREFAIKCGKYHRDEHIFIRLRHRMAFKWFEFKIFCVHFVIHNDNSLNYLNS